MRYTEIRMARIGHELLADIDKETVDFGPNYDGSEQEPAGPALTRIPNLLVNGSRHRGRHGDQHPPHNLGEDRSTPAWRCWTIRRPDIEPDQAHRRRPTSPTAGLIYGGTGVREGYLTGRGARDHARAPHVEDRIGKRIARPSSSTSCPTRWNKKRLLEKIAELVNEKKIEGISEIQDESDKSGMRLVIELKRGEEPRWLNNLFKQTQLQDTASA